MLDNINKDLIDRFRHIVTAPPSWAWQYPPSCPLVGRAYTPGEGLLVYASAENFTWMTREETPARFKDERAWNRYRVCYEDQGRNSNTFYPDVGIQPVTNGGLFVAGLFVADRLGLRTADTPRAFLETAAFTNWGKYTVKSQGGRQVNKDYAGVEEKLAESLTFVVAELTLLRPRIAMVPKTIWRRQRFQEAMRAASPSTRFVPIPQFNATVVNCHLKSFADQGRQLSLKTGPVIAEWMKNLHGFNEDCAWRYLGYLDDVLQYSEAD